MMNSTLLRLFGICGVLAHVACGGVEGELDFESETEDALSDDVETASADEAVARDPDGVLFESYASAQRWEPMLSRVRLVVAADCPTHITDGMLVPMRCLDVRSGRHTLIGDVDVVGEERTVRFHRLNNPFIDAPVSSLDDCLPERGPNRLADIHVAGVRKFIAAGFFKAGGERKYEVVYRRVGDVYRLLPARPKLEGMVWSVMKPGSGVCLRGE